MENKTKKSNDIFENYRSYTWFSWKETHANHTCKGNTASVLNVDLSLLNDFIFHLLCAWSAWSFPCAALAHWSLRNDSWWQPQVRGRREWVETGDTGARLSPRSKLAVGQKHRGWTASPLQNMLSLCDILIRTSHVSVETLASQAPFSTSMFSSSETKTWKSQNGKLRYGKWLEMSPHSKRVQFWALDLCVQSLHVCPVRALWLPPTVRKCARGGDWGL